MRQVVRMVEEASLNQPGSIPRLIRLQVSNYSHLADHSVDELQTTFQMAAQGSIAEHAKLEVTHVQVSGHCQSCGRIVQANDERLTCSACGSANLVWQDIPEMLVQEVECLIEPS